MRLLPSDSGGDRPLCPAVLHRVVADDDGGATQGVRGTPRCSRPLLLAYSQAPVLLG